MRVAGTTATLAVALFALALTAASCVRADPDPGGAPRARPRKLPTPKSRMEIMRERAEKERRRRHEEMLEEKAREMQRLVEERRRLAAEERRKLRRQFIAKEEERLRALQEQKKGEGGPQLPSWNALANSTAFKKAPGGKGGAAAPKPKPGAAPSGPARARPGLDMTPGARPSAEDVGEFGQRLDCYGVPGGYAVRDECGICGGDGSSCADCAGVPNGGAQEDCSGVCNGNDTSCADCAGVLNGEMRRDACGECGGDNTSCVDCMGAVNGDAVEDACGVCDGHNKSCADCMGVPNGGAAVDACGVCGGDGTSCCSPVPTRPRSAAGEEAADEEGDEEGRARMPDGGERPAPVLCSGRGTCSAAHRFCVCDHGWTGPFCTVRQDLCLHLEEAAGGAEGFAAAVCNGRGTCDPASGLCRCDDPEAWMGPRCEFSRCSRRGAYDLEAGRCVCEHGYGGAHCERCASTAPRDGQTHVCVEIVGAWQPVPRDLFLDRSILLGEKTPRAPVFTLIDADDATAEAYLAGHHLINIGSGGAKGGGMRRDVIHPNSTHKASGYYYDCGCRLAAPPLEPQPVPGPEGEIETIGEGEAVEGEGERAERGAPADTVAPREYRPFFPKRSTIDRVEAPYAMPLRSGDAASRGAVEGRAPRSVAECSAVHQQILEEYGYSIEAARAESYELARSVGSVSSECDTSFGLAWSVLAILTALVVGAVTWFCIWCVQRNVRFRKDKTGVL